MDLTLTPARHDAIVATLSRASGDLTTAAVRAMDERLPWFAELPAEARSWITVVARAGIDGFIEWLDAREADAAGVFGAAPRAMLRHVSLFQTVELVRTTIDVLGEQLPSLLEPADADVVERSILAFSGEVAFAVAVVYARAAEMRGTWDDRLEALVIDAIVRGDADEDTLSRASSLGWHVTSRVCVVVGAANTETRVEEVRTKATRLGLEVLTGTLGDRMVLVLGGTALAEQRELTTAIAGFLPLFGASPVVHGPVVESLLEAGTSARAALAGLRAAPGWPGVPDVVAAEDLLPERALLGDELATDELVAIAELLEGAGGDLLLTAEAFLDQQLSVEATARALFVHANTVRYRLKRIQEVAGYSLTDARDAYVLRLGLTLRRLTAGRG